MKLKKVFSSLVVFLLIGIFACVGVSAAGVDEASGNSTSSTAAVVTQSENASKSASNPTSETTDSTAQNTTQVEQQGQSVPSVIYSAHVQNIGTQSEVADGALAGTIGKGYRLEAFRVRLENAGNSKLSYSAHIQNLGWKDYNQNELAGTTGKALRVEAIKIKLNGDLANQYDIVYRVHVQDFGWLNWARNGEPAGTVSKSLRVEAMQIKLVKKGETPTNDPVNTPSANSKAFLYDTISYYTHVQNIGTQSWKADGEIAGTTGKSLRVEGIAIKVADPEYLGTSGNIDYRAHVQNVGWQDWKKNGAYAGTTGQGLRMEAIQIKLDGDLANQYDVYYSCHVQNYGWLAWAKNGESSGTEGLALRVEAIQIKLVKKGEAAPSNNGRDSHSELTKAMFKDNLGVSYQTHVQNIGWTDWSKNGATSGTTGKGLRIEGYRVAVQDNLANNSYITYHSHIQNIGNQQAWQDSRNGSAYSGTSGKSLRVEAVQMKLNGYASGAMDVWYRVHVQNYGWLGWAKNGEWAGTSNGSLRIEAVQVVLRPKSEGASGSTARHYIHVNLYPQANAVLNHIGRNLRAAYNWSAGLTYWRQYYSPNMGTRWYANIGFTQHRGNCYVMAATFTEMARALGYDAHQVVGFVPHIGGGDAPHSWVEIDEKDGTWVYDPNLTNELHLPAFHFKYGKAKTWRYYKYHRTKLR
ncbi:MAG: hypothetical protein DUD26_05860 [Eubacteriaceae bacterium]|uniref:Transglutaminase-like domain-containing protein n=1 Tax=Candidatus Pseudoramibacter fermentans TaxID=2594427 RepID=A0A6L5GTU8_9FIRM|nr:hypothetical protein [Candidatus Pseudoramibacter fermentans]RRF92785.1 MAG: hypothetical protein DUD26_05860 [Eubacteriaceae bacterium]